MEGALATATHHHTGRPGTAVVILSVFLCVFFFFLFLFIRQADDLSAWSQEVDRDTVEEEDERRSSFCCLWNHSSVFWSRLAEHLKESRDLFIFHQGAKRKKKRQLLHPWRYTRIYSKVQSRRANRENVVEMEQRSVYYLTHPRWFGILHLTVLQLWGNVK